MNNDNSNNWRQILSDLVAFDTTSDKSNLALIDYIKAYLHELHIPFVLVPNEQGDKCSLFATITGNKSASPQSSPQGFNVAPGIALSGHTDTVPVTGQNWQSNPFQLRQEQNRLYGRGTCDMKGFLAVMLASAPLFQARPLTKPVHLIFSYDEETGCTGVRPLIDQLGIEIVKPEMVIVGEPSSGNVVEAHKSITSYTTTVTGHEAHSSHLHRGVSAISIAAKLVDKLNFIQEELKARQNDVRFDPPYSTVHVGTITGGTARNIVAKECSFFWEVRALPDFDPDLPRQQLMSYAKTQLLDGMKQISGECAIETTARGHVPGLSADNHASHLALKIAGQNKVSAVSYGTEAGLFQLGGVPAVICGPGDIAQAHKPDEYITIEQMEMSLEFMTRLADHLSA